MLTGAICSRRHCGETLRLVEGGGVALACPGCTRNTDGRCRDCPAPVTGKQRRCRPCKAKRENAARMRRYLADRDRELRARRQRHRIPEVRARALVNMAAYRKAHPVIRDDVDRLYHRLWYRRKRAAAKAANRAGSMPALVEVG